jgi:putative membrane protein
MILPGISGSYLLLIFRKYDYILSQLGTIGTIDTVQALLNLIPFFMGCLVGIILFSRLLSWLLKNFHTATLMVLIGFLIGSLYVIWPYQNRTFEDHIRETEIVEMNDPIVEELQSRETIPLGPEYQRLGEVENPNATFDRLKRIEVETVSRKLVSSQPFFPFYNWSENDESIDLYGGLVGMGIGLSLIFAISYLRKKQ